MVGTIEFKASKIAGNSMKERTSRLLDYRNRNREEEYYCFFQKLLSLGPD